MPLKIKLGEVLEEDLLLGFEIELASKNISLDGSERGLGFGPCPGTRDELTNTPAVQTNVHVESSAALIDSHLKNAYSRSNIAWEIQIANFDSVK
jgi:hypothetical protein